MALVRRAALQRVLLGPTDHEPCVASLVTAARGSSNSGRVVVLGLGRKNFIEELFNLLLRPATTFVQSLAAELHPAVYFRNADDGPFVVQLHPQPAIGGQGFLHVAKISCAKKLTSRDAAQGGGRRSIALDSAFRRLSDVLRRSSKTRQPRQGSGSGRPIRGALGRLPLHWSRSRNLRRRQLAAFPKHR